MIVYDNAGHGYNIALGKKGKCTFAKFKATFCNIPFDYEKVFIQLGGKIKDNGTQEPEEAKEPAKPKTSSKVKGK